MSILVLILNFFILEILIVQISGVNWDYWHFHICIYYSTTMCSVIHRSYLLHPLIPFPVPNFFFFGFDPYSSTFFLFLLSSIWLILLQCINFLVLLRSCIDYIDWPLKSVFSQLGILEVSDWGNIMVSFSWGLLSLQDIFSLCLLIVPPL